MGQVRGTRAARTGPGGHAFLCRQGIAAVVRTKKRGRGESGRARRPKATISECSPKRRGPDRLLSDRRRRGACGSCEPERSGGGAGGRGQRAGRCRESRGNARCETGWTCELALEASWAGGCEWERRGDLSRAASGRPMGRAAGSGRGSHGGTAAGEAAGIGWDLRGGQRRHGAREGEAGASRRRKVRVGAWKARLLKASAMRLPGLQPCDLRLHPQPRPLGLIIVPQVRWRPPWATAPLAPDKPAQRAPLLCRPPQPRAHVQPVVLRRVDCCSSGPSRPSDRAGSGMPTTSRSASSSPAIHASPGRAPRPTGCWRYRAWRRLPSPSDVAPAWDASSGPVQRVPVLSGRRRARRPPGHGAHAARTPSLSLPASGIPRGLSTKTRTPALLRPN